MMRVMMRANPAHLFLPFSFALIAACGGSQTDEPATTAPGESSAAIPPTTESTAPATQPAAAAAAPADSAATGPAAPDFTLPDVDGQPVALSSFRGKTVVLEWFNPGCPFVRYAHSEGPLKALAKKHTDGGIVWLAINSGAPGKQGAGAEVNRQASKEWAMQHPILIDEKGQVGRAYDAKTSPHMFVINPAGQIVYRGALDNAPLGKIPADGKIDYLENALASLAANKPVEVAETKPYGCSVKYAE